MDTEKIFEYKSKIDKINHMLSRMIEIKSRIHDIECYYLEYVEISNELQDITTKLENKYKNILDSDMD